MRGATFCCFHTDSSILEFQSTLPMRGATSSHTVSHCSSQYFNPHSPCGERPCFPVFSVPTSSISIHTPHAGSDVIGALIFFLNSTFQSTLPMRGATSSRFVINPHSQNFNPHSPCGERPSLHTPYASCSVYFNPHSPCGERRFTVMLPVKHNVISIHTPHAGSDSQNLDLDGG